MGFILMLIEGHTSIYCMSGKQFKSEDYVSAAREVSQTKIIAHFICKASLAGKKIIAEIFAFCKESPIVISSKSSAIFSLPLFPPYQQQTINI